jgi:DNA-binding MarR family transcriptional regulator
MIERRTVVREARKLEKDRIVEFSKRWPDPARRRKRFVALTVTEAIGEHIRERRGQVSERMLKYWTENGRRLVAVSTTATRPGRLASHEERRSRAILPR